MPSQDRLLSYTVPLYKTTVGCFVVFDITQAWTFESITERKAFIDKNARLPDGSPIPCVLLASKVGYTIIKYRRKWIIWFLISVI